ncbi:N-6 DNA methylase [Photobacterium sp. S4TG1]|uniref:N-6 DNA methylase n=1 Tax=Photobacterium sp. S4TG1 TaxID=3114587 RepID=UPI002E190FCF|nr:N-6 DNA methylase [Photobacterium sp. S4TG1]
MLITIENDNQIKHLVSKLHDCIWNLESNSNIVDRFDELVKVILISSEISKEGNNLGVDSVRNYYEAYVEGLEFIVPDNFKLIKLKDNTINEVVKIIRNYDLRNLVTDFKGMMYEEIIKNTFEKGDNQQFFTPPSIVKFMCDILSVVSSGDVCDPASGTGGFLIELIKRKGHFNSYTAMEIDDRLAWVSGVNMLSHGASNFSTLYHPDGGSLGLEAEKYFDTFDAIVTNPPFGSEYSDSEQLDKYELGKGKSSRRRGVLFIERCLKFLKENGHLAIIIDNSVLNGKANSDVRDLIISNCEIVSIINLPEETFKPYASVQSSILLLRKTKRPSRDAKTFFASPEKVGKKGNGDADYTFDDKGNEVLNSDLEQILNAFKEFFVLNKTNDSELFYSTSVIDTFKVSDGDNRLDFMYHHYSRAVVSDLLKIHSDNLYKLSDVCDEITYSVNPSQDLQGDYIKYTGLSNIEANSDIFYQSTTHANSVKSSVKKYTYGDVLYSKLRPELRKSVASKFEDGVCSSECFVFRIKDEFSNLTPELLAAILRSDFVYGQIVHKITGTGRPRIGKKDIMNVLIPYDGKLEKTIVEYTYLKDMNEIKRLKLEIASMLRKVETLKGDATLKVVNKLLGVNYDK